MHEATTVNVVMFKLCLLQGKYKLNGKIVTHIEIWLGCCTFSSRRFNVQVLTDRKKTVVAITARAGAV